MSEYVKASKLIWILRSSKYMAATVAALIAGLLIVELLMRLFYLGNEYSFNPDNQHHTFIDGKNQITIKEGFGIRTVNKYGTFDIEEKPWVEKEDRYLLFGDSMSEAFQVHDSQVYDNIAEQIVLETTGEEIEIVNFGRSGYATIDEIVLYQHVAKIIPHKYVIVQFSSGDAIENTISNNKVVNGNIVPFDRSEKRSMIKSIFWKAKEVSVLVNTLHYRSDMLRSYIKSLKSGTKLETIEEKKETRRISKFEEEMMLQLLDTFYKIVKENGAKMIFIRIVRDDTCEGSYEALSRFVDEKNIPYLELYERLDSTEVDERRFGFLNTKMGVGHMNRYGHYVTGRMLAEELIEMEMNQ